MTPRNSLLAWPAPPADADIFVNVELDIAPLPKSRARTSPAEYETVNGVRRKVRNARTYTPEKTEDYETHLGWLLRRARVHRNDVDDLGVRAIFYVKGRQRRDLDNLLKALLDAANGIVWRDDQQVVQIVSDLARNSDRPRIELVVYVVQHRARTCDTCDTVLTPTQVTHDQTFCSKGCYDTSQRQGRNRSCSACGMTVHRRNIKALAKEVFCSPECRTARRNNCRMCGERAEGPPASGSAFCSPACSEAWHRQKALVPRSKPRGTCISCKGPTYSSAPDAKCRACYIRDLGVSGRNATRGPTYNACPDCGGRKRTTSIRCMTCSIAAVRRGEIGRWAKQLNSGGNS